MPFRPDEVIIHDELEQTYESWSTLAAQGKKPAQSVWASMQRGISRLKSDAQWGKLIRQQFIPKYFRERYGLSNLYCINLADFHRCFYTIVNRSVILLDIVDHPTYDKWFPGRKDR